MISPPSFTFGQVPKLHFSAKGTYHQAETLPPKIYDFSTRKGRRLHGDRSTLRPERKITLKDLDCCGLFSAVSNLIKSKPKQEESMALITKKKKNK